MDISVAHGATPQAALQNLGPGSYDFVSMHANCAIGAQAANLTTHIPALHGATSCLGSMTHEGVTDGVSVFAIRDADGAYGTAVVEFDADPRAAASQATKQALANADRLGEQPVLVWISTTPGTEEEIIAGVEDTVGPDIPILGGSAADNSVSGDWFVFDGQTCVSSGVIVSVLFPSGPVSFAYHSGYSPTQDAGTVTKAEGRTIYEIDHKPAMDVYSQWTGGDVPKVAAGEESTAILSESTLWPLGREISQVGDVPFYLLAHPAVARSDGAFDLFATVEQGEVLTLMNGTKDSLTSRAGRVAALARERGRLTDKPIAGALMIYCGGCMLSVQDRLDDVVGGVNTALEGAPFLGAFTFGEQGSLVKAGNQHGNLMISCIVFG